MFENQLQTLSIQSSSQMLNQTQNGIKNLSKLEEGRDNKSPLPQEARITTPGTSQMTTVIISFPKHIHILHQYLLYCI